MDHWNLEIIREDPISKLYSQSLAHPSFHCFKTNNSEMLTSIKSENRVKHFPTKTKGPYNVWQTDSLMPIIMLKQETRTKIEDHVSQCLSMLVVTRLL